MDSVKWISLNITKPNIFRSAPNDAKLPWVSTKLQVPVGKKTKMIFSFEDSNHYSHAREKTDVTFILCLKPYGCVYDTVFKLNFTLFIFQGDMFESPISLTVFDNDLI